MSLSQLYPLARQKFATGALNWPALNVKILLLANSYVPNFTNQFLSDVNSAAIIATSPNIAGLTAINGYCGGDTTNFGVIDSGIEAGKLIFYQDTGTSTTSPLLVFFDTPDLPGLPAVLNGLNYYVYQNFTYGGWFRL